MSEWPSRVPPLFWVKEGRSGRPLNVSLLGLRALCLFGAQIRAVEYAEYHVGGEPDVDWQVAGSEEPDDLLRVADGAMRQGFGGWVLDPPLDVPDAYPISSWSELREEVERKVDVGAAWGSPPPSLRELPQDPETMALLHLLSPAAKVLQGPSSPYEAPGWVEDFQRNPRTIEFVGKGGAETLEEWRSQTEERMATLIGRRPWSLLHLLGLLRRLPNDKFFLGESQEEGGLRRFDPFQANVAERVALKYARWDVCGTETEDWEPGPPGLALDKPSLDVDVLADVWALAQHAGVGLAQIDNMRKTVVRGGKVFLRPDGVADARQEEPRLRRLLDLYDERRRKFSFVGATAGTFHPSDIQAEPGEKSVSRVLRTAYREDEGGGWWGYDVSRRRIRKRDKRFMFSVVNLEPAYEYMKLLEDEVYSQYGLTPEAIVSALTAINRMVVAHFLAPDGLPAGLLPERIAHLDRRGYLLVHEDLMDGVVLGRWTTEAYRRAFPYAPDPSSAQGIAPGFKRLAYLDSYGREDLNILDGSPWSRRPGLEVLAPMPPPFIYPAGTHRIVDLGAVNSFVQGLFDCLVLEEGPRQRVAGDLERRLGVYFEDDIERPRAFEPSQKLYVKPPGQSRRVLAELDASIRVGSVLLAVDAKSIRASLGYRRYEHSALRTRWLKFERYVQHADEQADKLARQPKGTNYDLLAEGYTHVVTLLCSAMPEYVDTDDSNFYVRNDLPRIATPLELRTFLGEAQEDELKALPFAKRIDR